MNTTTDLACSFVSVFTRSPDHPLHDVLTHLTDEGHADRQALQALVHAWNEQLPPVADPTARSTDALALHLKRATANILLGEASSARHDLTLVLHEATCDMRGMAALILGLLESHQKHHQPAYQALLIAFTSLQQERDDRKRVLIALPVLVWYLANTLIHLHRYQQAHHLLTDVLETLTTEVSRAHRATIAELYAQRGVILSHLRFPRRAMLDLNQAIRLNPEKGRLYHVRGLIHMQQCAWTAAYHDLWRALHDEPENRILAQAFTLVLSHLAHHEVNAIPRDNRHSQQR